MIAARHMAWLATASLALLASQGARADAVTEQLDKAAAAYQQHDVPGTIAALDVATTLLRQGRADALQALLPSPPPGWSADPAETSSLSAAMLGGGTSATRTYHHDDQQVVVQFTADSPMLQSVATLISGPLAESAGIRTVMVGGRALGYTLKDNGYITLVADKVVVKIDGNTAVPEPVLRSFVAAIDFDAIEKLAH
ncbi:MAG: hypothetical protein P4L71_21525 [Acetobacteraceae bacterium]|nr:hypothetical protein [Acetobacteraceae bacterium]